MGTKADRRRKLEKQTVMFLRRRYKLFPEVSSLTATNAAQTAALDAWNAWVASVWAELTLRLDEVDAAADEATWDAVRIDRETLRTADPNLKIRQFLRLT
ncbi:MAG: hypothetical protein K0U84_15150 [Actinomycetia bacterium]|nr:hypothetical protein [Actinomycetes bacterium]